MKIAFVNGFEAIRFPVPDEIWQRDLDDTKQELQAAVDPHHRKQLEADCVPKLNENQIPTLHYLYATSALDSLLTDRYVYDGMDHFSPRYDAISKAERDIRDAVWQGHDAEPLINQLASLLYQSDASYNVTRDETSARIVAAQVEDVAQHAKDKVLGLGVNRGK